MINRVILVGRLGKDPEVRHLENDVTVANFPIATTESYKDKSGQKVETTEWHNIVLWRGLARVAESYLKKGDLVYIEGKIRTRSWDDKEGNKRYTTEIYGENMTMLSGKNSEGSAVSDAAPQYAEHKSAQPLNPIADIIDSPEDDLPF